MALLQFDKLSFAYPNAERRAIDDVSFTMEEGEYIVLCGPSGCGKTTILLQAKPELTPAGAKKGRVLYNGIPVNELDAMKAATEIGFVQQNPDNQIVTDFVWHELAFGLENMGLPTSAIRRRVAEMASFFGMETWFRKKTSEISGGQKQLLNLASVMAMGPKLLIMDEPTAMLDPLAARTLLETVKRINKDLGVAILMTEHRLEEVFPAADKVMVMDNGRLLAYGDPRTIAMSLAGEKDKSRLYFGLPSAVRIFAELDSDEMPLTVRDGRLAIKTILGDRKTFEHTEIKKEKAKKDKKDKNDFVLKAEELWFRYDEKGADILRGFDLKLKRGEIMCLLGGNGAGKTTLMKLLSGIKKPYRGKVDVAKDAKICMLPQNVQSVFTCDTVERELLESAEEDLTRMEETVKLLELEKLLKRHPYDLSGGEAQRAAIAKLLLRNGNVLLLDEPTKGLDAYAKKCLAGALRKITSEGRSVLIVTHDVEFAASYVDRCVMMFDGIAISADAPHEFFSGNRFYTTDANRIAAEYFPKAITCEEVIALCKNYLLAKEQEQQPC